MAAQDIAYDKQITKEIVIALISHTTNPALLFSPGTKPEYKFEAIWNAVFKTVSAQGLRTA